MVRGIRECALRCIGTYWGWPRAPRMALLGSTKLAQELEQKGHVFQVSKQLQHLWYGCLQIPGQRRQTEGSMYTCTSLNL